MSKKTSGLSAAQRDKLILALQLEEITGAINLVLKKRKASLEIDYTIDHSPRLFVERPGVPREPVMLLDVRKHACYLFPPKNRELFFIFTELFQSLEKFEAYLRLSAHKPKQGPRRCVLQVCMPGVNTIAVTLMETFKGKKIKDTSFQLPDGTTP